MFAFKGIHHVALFVSLLAAAKDFYFRKWRHLASFANSSRGGVYDDLWMAPVRQCHRKSATQGRVAIQF